MKKKYCLLSLSIIALIVLTVYAICIHKALSNHTNMHGTSEITVQAENTETLQDVYRIIENSSNMENANAQYTTENNKVTITMDELDQTSMDLIIHELTNDNENTIKVIRTTTIHKMAHRTTFYIIYLVLLALFILVTYFIVKLILQFKKTSQGTK